MSTCPKCNKELKKGSAFCDGCGSQVYETVLCPNCGKQTKATSAFCHSCGTSLAGTADKSTPVAAPAKKKKAPKKAIIFGGIALGVVAVAIVAVALLLGGGKFKKTNNNYALYLKNNEIYFSDLKKNSENCKLTSNLLESFDLTNEEFSDYASLVFSSFIRFSKDGKHISFPDKISDEYGCSLYYSDVNKLDEQTIKIASDVMSYQVNDSFTIFTYLKSDYTLHQYDIRKDTKKKIASDVSGYIVSSDGKKICYHTNEHNLYLKNGDKEKEKIAGDISDIIYSDITNDSATVYYTKDDTMYKYVEGNDTIKIASDVYEDFSVYESGEIYYCKSASEEISLEDYVTDDMKKADASLSAPDYPDYPSSPRYPYSWNYDTDAEYDAAMDKYEVDYDKWEAECERLEDEYYAAREEYYSKLNRDELREELKDKKITITKKSLYYYNGEEEVLITDKFNFSSVSFAIESPVIAYSAYNPSDIKKIKLSEIESIYDVEEMIENALFSSSEKYIAVKNNSTLIEQKKTAGNFVINSAGTVVYYMDEISDENEHGDLYRISISDGKPASPELYNSDVFYAYCEFINNDEFKYYKNYDDAEGDLYINETLIDSDVKDYDRTCSYSTIFSYQSDDSKRFFYFTDWNDDKNYGTLKFYDGKESITVSDDVTDFSLLPDGRILYLYDYNINTYEGELYEWSDGKTREIDDDVNFILPVFMGEMIAKFGRFASIF